MKGGSRENQVFAHCDLLIAEEAPGYFFGGGRHGHLPVFGERGFKFSAFLCHRCFEGQVQFSRKRKRCRVTREIGAVEALEENGSAVGFGKVLGNAGPDELAGGVGHAAADDEAFGTALLHHLCEEEGVQFGGSVRYGETRVSIAVRVNF